MSDIYIVYCGFMYLLTLGAVVRCFMSSTSVEPKTQFGMAINLVFAPILTPIILGAILYDLDLS